MRIGFGLCYNARMKSDIRWDEIAKIEMRPGAQRPEFAIKAIAKHTPSPKKKQAKARAKRVVATPRRK